MIAPIIHRYSEKFLSRWAVLGIDLFILASCVPIAMLLRFNFDIGDFDMRLMVRQTGITLLLFGSCFAIFKSYAGIIRHTGIADAVRLMGAAGAALGLAIVVATVVSVLPIKPAGGPFFSLSIFVITLFLAVVALISFRFSVKYVFQQVLQGKKLGRTRVLIYGAGSSGQITRNTLSQDLARLYEIVGYVDDNQQKWGKRIDGIPVFPPTVLNEEEIGQLRIHHMVIAIQHMPQARRQEIIEKGLELGIKVKAVPAINNWINGNLTVKQIKNVRIEDLLEREPIALDSRNVKDILFGKVVFVTGAAGSIGSEIARQIMFYGPKQVVFIDNAESALHDLEVELRYKHPNLTQSAVFITADITDPVRMRSLFGSCRPDKVFHAAAYKHVPLMEAHPYEAVRVNLLGTRLVADLSIEFGVSKFVMVSTDKAVNPTNVMGASKRMAEIYIQAQDGQGGTHFITTRFGNVLGSNGSVIPLFRKQIAGGGPVTITHPDITRFFMTIPEACNLVLEAGAMGNGGEIFVFDMGRSVRIVDLAEKMIRLSGLRPGEDIEIKFTGLRPGEKLYEELLADSESTLPTHHPKIMKASVRASEASFAKVMADRAADLLTTADDFAIVGLMKEFVPEFVSNNSVYSKLDEAAAAV